MKPFLTSLFTPLNPKVSLMGLALFISCGCLAQSFVSKKDTSSTMKMAEQHFKNNTLEKGIMFNQEFMEFVCEKRGIVNLTDEEYKELIDEFYKSRTRATKLK